MRTVSAKFLMWVAAVILSCGMSPGSAQSAATPVVQDSFDNFRPVDSEQLLANALIAMEAGDFEQAKPFISDALQIIKVNHGLFATEQMVALQLLADTYLAQQDWPGLDQQLAYFEWLLRNLSTTNIEAYLQGTEILHRLYLRAAADQQNPQNAHYLIAAKQLNWRAVTVIELTHGKDSLLLAPWLYNVVLTHYYQSTLTRRKGMTSFDYKSNAPDIVSGWSLSKNESLAQSYGIGQELLQRIRTLYARSPGTAPASDALMLLYLADWELLFGQDDAALAYYNTAYAALQRVEADTSVRAAWFGRPVIIPLPTFVDSWPPQGDVNDALEFEAWSPVFPGAHRPAVLARTNAGARQRQAIVRLDLRPVPAADAGLPHSAPFLYRVDRLQIESVTPANPLTENQARQQIADLQFRPLLVDGVVTPARDILLHYMFPAETDLSLLSDTN